MHQNASKSNEGNTLKSIKESNEGNTRILDILGGVVKVIRKVVDVKTVRKASFCDPMVEMSEYSCFSHCSMYFLILSAALFKRCRKV